ncbi:TraR/DksA C4-type zinc finger protein [Pseudoalteromonas xiamenensis]
MDIADNAQVIADLQLSIALNNQHHHSHPTGAEFIHCQECGDEIPKARREAIHNCATCADCQELLERQAKHFRKR